MKLAKEMRFGKGKEFTTVRLPVRLIFHTNVYKSFKSKAIGGFR
jgi:hypothetical protein